MPWDVAGQRCASTILGIRIHAVDQQRHNVYWMAAQTLIILECGWIYGYYGITKTVTKLLFPGMWLGKDAPPVQQKRKSVL